MSETGTCEHCAAPIVWIKDQAGKRIPLNKTRVRAYVLAKEGTDLRDRYLMTESGPFLSHLSHFVTCPKFSKASKRQATEAYHEGWADAVRLYAVWKDGEQFVGVSQHRLDDVLAVGPPQGQQAISLARVCDV